jgi:hypothetical protein
MSRSSSIFVWFVFIVSFIFVVCFAFSRREIFAATFLRGSQKRGGIYRPAAVRAFGFNASFTPSATDVPS